MSTTHNDTTTNPELLDEIEEFYRTYYHKDIQQLAQKYPSEQKSLDVDYRDIETKNPNLADDVRDRPQKYREYFEKALANHDLPVDVDLIEANVRFQNLPDWLTFYPGMFSPTDRSGELVALRGDVSKSTAVYSKVIKTAFECKRCGTLTRIPQADGGEFQEPHECEGCERQGPFVVNFDQSEFVDAQKLRLQTPHEIRGGAGEDIDVFVEDDLADVAETGDRVTVTGSLHLEQATNGNQKTGRFDPYVEAHAIELEETDHTDLEISDEERARIRALASGEEGDPLEVAAESLAVKVHGYDQLKRMLVLAMVGGQKVVYGDTDHDRGEFHVLLLGDPGTAKSKLIDRVEALGFRSMGVSGEGATTAGLTATAKQDDFGAADWTLEAGAFVKANNGVVCIDELDDMPADVRSAMLEPMSKQSIHVNKAGINTRLATETAVVAAGNPKYGRFDPYEPVFDQFDIESNLLSRFDLIFTMKDRPDPEEDVVIGDHVLTTRDVGKRKMRNEDVDLEDDPTERPVDEELLRKWIAVAKQQDPPVFASEDVKEWLEESFHDLRGLHGYDEEATVPVTFRKLEGIIRIAEAAARFELSETIEMRHARTATRAVGQSIQDYGKNEEGELDADVQESGLSKTQQERMDDLKTVVQEQQGQQGGADVQTVVEAMCERGYTESTVWDAIENVKSNGEAYEPETGEIRWLGRA